MSPRNTIHLWAAGGALAAAALWLVPRLTLLAGVIGRGLPLPAEMMIAVPAG